MVLRPLIDLLDGRLVHDGKNVQWNVDSASQIVIIISCKNLLRSQA
jgi:hypothetical protein